MVKIEGSERPMSDSFVMQPKPEAVQNQDAPAYALDQQVGFLLRQAQQRHTAIFARLMPDDVTPTQWATLAKLHEIGGCSQNLLGPTLRWTRRRSRVWSTVCWRAIWS